MTNRLVKAAGLGLLVLGGLKLNDSFARSRTEEHEARPQIAKVSAYEEASQGLLGDGVGLGALFGGAYLVFGRKDK
jgi:hypothetical protein